MKLVTILRKVVTVLQCSACITSPERERHSEHK